MPTTYNDPIMLDSTGQDIVDKLDSIASLMGDGVIDDTSTTATDKTWSASKENTTVNGLKSNINANTKLIKDTVGWSGKNIFDFASFATTAVRCTYTFTNSTGTYFLKVTDASDNAQVQIVFNNDILRKYAGKDVRISIASHTKSNPNMVPYVVLYKNNALVDNFGDNGIPKSSFTFTVPSTIESSDVFLFVIRANQNRSASVNDTLTITGLMASLADILDPTYEPYFGSTAFPRSEQAVLGAKNLLVFPYYEASGRESSGITYTYGSDGIITANGTKGTSPSFLNLSLSTDIANFGMKVGGSYILSGGVDSAKFLRIELQDSGGTAVATYTSNNDEVMFTIPSGVAKCKFYIAVTDTAQLTNVKFYPMLRLATDTDPTYVPYAMTNKELTPQENTTDGVTTSFTFDTNGKTLVKQGNIVLPYIRVTGVTVTANDDSTPICVLAEGYRPRFSRILPVFASGQIKSVFVNTNGKIVSSENLSNSTVTIMIPWTV